MCIRSVGKPLPFEFKADFPSNESYDALYASADVERRRASMELFKRDNRAVFFSPSAS